MFTESIGLHVEIPRSISDSMSLLKAIDLLIVAAYGQILPEDVISAPALGSVNVHPSILPRWRGATPVEHAILAGDCTTGVSLMQVTKRLDAGPVFNQVHIDLNGRETTAALTNNLAELGAQLLVEHLAKVQKEGSLEPTPQDEAMATYARRLKKEDARINWCDSASKIERQVRAGFDQNPAFTTQESVRMRILHAEIVDGIFKPGLLYINGLNVVIGTSVGGLRLHTVQLNIGKGRPMSVAQAMNGFKDLFVPGVQFETPA